MKTIWQIRTKQRSLYLQLIVKCKKSWIYENFWQKEVHKLKEYVGDIYSYTQDNRTQAQDIIISFNDRCMNYCG